MNIYNKLKQLNNQKSICLISHIDPDPDAISSMVVFREFLLRFFNVERVDIFAESLNISNPLSEILGSIQLNNTPADYQVAIMLDSPNPSRLGKFEYLFNSSNKKIVIDHHKTNTCNGDINIIELCSSTCEIIYSILKYFKFEISSSLQGKIYSGIITDTNNFSVGEFGKRTFKIASEISENIDMQAIYRAFLANNSLKTMNLLSLTINNIKSYENNTIIITHISHEQANQFRITPNDTCGLINQIATINTSKMVCLIDSRSSKYYVSMRAKKPYDVSSIAKKYGGGGHVGAAAFLSESSLEEIEKLILLEFKHQLKTINPEQHKLFS